MGVNQKFLISFCIFISILSNSLAVADDCKKAVELYNKGTLSRNLEEKQRYFQKALDLTCSKKEIISKIHNNLADTYENKGLFKEAIEEYKKAIELDPSLPTPYISLGDVYSKMGDLQLASDYYEKYWKLVSFKTKEQLRSSLSIRSTTRAIRPVPSAELYFGFNESLLTEEAKRQLEELLSALQNDDLRSYRFQLSGHTCSIGTDEYNQRLSERRAKSVKDWLVAHDYPETQLKIAGFGEKRPIADNSTEEGRRINRRVEIKTVGVTVDKTTKRNCSPDKTEGLILIEQGLRLSSEGKNKEAASVFEEALKLYKEKNFHEGIEAVLGNLYLVYLSLGNDEKAGVYLEELQNKDKK